MMYLGYISTLLRSSVKVSNETFRENWLSTLNKHYHSALLYSHFSRAFHKSPSPIHCAHGFLQYADFLTLTLTNIHSSKACLTKHNLLSVYVVHSIHHITHIKPLITYVSWWIYGFNVLFLFYKHAKGYSLRKKLPRTIT